jgi:catechol 2,3-dioxygenase-like lactoylglutathione lyase family enzyme
MSAGDAAPGPLDLVTIQVRDWPAAVDWYQRVLGLELVAIEEHDHFCLLGTGTGGAMVALACDHPEQARSTEENRLAPGFRVDDLDATLDRLRTGGARVDPIIEGEDEGYRLARVWDDEGNRLHLYSYGGADG